jgi:hypothetical protein
MKAPPNHIALVSDSLSLFCPFLIEDSEDGKEFFKETYSTLPFPGNKVLKLEKELDTKWHDAFMEVMKGHYDFVM